MKVRRKFLLLMPVMTFAALVQAADDFTVVLRNNVRLDMNKQSMVLSFTLPSNVSLSSSIANSAILQLEAHGSNLNFNEVYVNPPNDTCTDNDNDLNQSKSIGVLDEHDDTNLRVEWVTNHIAFSSSFLNAGANKLLFCVRDSSGNMGPGRSVDEISIKSAVIHYHTN